MKSLPGKGKVSANWFFATGVLFVLLATLACQAGENLVHRLQTAATPTSPPDAPQELGVQPPMAGEATPTPALADTLRLAAMRHDLHIGAAVDWGFLNGDASYRELLTRQFNLITPENEMKFTRLEPAPGHFDFTNADLLVDFARQNGMLVRGGPLVWDQQLPDWLQNGNFTRAELKQILYDYIQTVVSHFRGQVVAWDVVNEALTDDGQLRDTLWLRAIGPEYIALAFQWAHAADPQALLFYNEFKGEGLNRKSDAIYALALGLKQASIPIDGIGWQTHVFVGQSPDAMEMAANFKRLADLGLSVNITEMDVRVGVDQQARPARLQTQAAIYRRVLRACLDASNCNMFEVWGVTDQYSWYNVNRDPSQKDAPLLFDENGDPKPAYFALLDELNQ
jgi:endo-1,4-beta-xylanase